jgi:predicted ester cyclase
MGRLIAVAAPAVMVPLLALTQPPASSKSMDQEARNEEVVRAATEAMNRGDLKAYVSYWAEDTKNFDRPVGREGIRQAIEDIFTTFPDYRHDVIEVIARGDSVVVRCTTSGTHRGVGKLKVNGGMLLGVTPTQKHFEVQHIHWYKLREGKIVMHTANRDDLGMMRQLGLLPTEGLPKCL